MEEKDKIIVKWAQEDVETSNNLLNYNNKVNIKMDIPSRLVFQNCIFKPVHRFKIIYIYIYIYIQAQLQPAAWIPPQPNRTLTLTHNKSRTKRPMW